MDGGGWEVGGLGGGDLGLMDGMFDIVVFYDAWRGPLE